MFKFPVLIGDIGGTSSRFAVLSGPGGPLSHLVVVATAIHATPSTAIPLAVKELGGPPPRSAFLGIAGRVDAPIVRLTNASWTVDAPRIGMDLRFTTITLVNDYVPLAAILPSLDTENPGELARIGPALASVQGNRIAPGPVTGVGVAACISVLDRSWLQPTEAGHMAFGACEAEELAIWPLIDRVNGRTSVETVLSRPGLVRLHRAFARRMGCQAQSRMSADVIENCQFSPVQFP
jgi:glucokinase